MATSLNWPVGLPAYVNVDYTESNGVLILSTPMDMGVSKLRRRGKKPSLLNVSYYMTNAQINTLDTFVNDTIKGTARFNFTHPRKETSIEVRIVPNGNGELYTVNYYTIDKYIVSLQLEIMP